MTRPSSHSQRPRVPAAQLDAALPQGHTRPPEPVHGPCTVALAAPAPPLEVGTSKVPFHHPRYSPAMCPWSGTSRNPLAPQQGVPHTTLSASHLTFCCVSSLRGFSPSPSSRMPLPRPLPLPLMPTRVRYLPSGTCPRPPPCYSHPHFFFFSHAFHCPRLIHYRPRPNPPTLFKTTSIPPILALALSHLCQIYPQLNHSTPDTRP